MSKPKNRPAKANRVTYHGKIYSHKCYKSNIGEATPPMTCNIKINEKIGRRYFKIDCCADTGATSSIITDA